MLARGLLIKKKNTGENGGKPKKKALFFILVFAFLFNIGIMHP